MDRQVLTIVIRPAELQSKSWTRAGLLNFRVRDQGPKLATGTYARSAAGDEYRCQSYKIYRTKHRAARAMAF